MESISLRNIKYSVTAKDATEKNVILQNVNLQLQQSSVLCIGGQSGQGKSTLLRLISGLLKPDSGQVFFSGVESKPHEHNALNIALVHKVAFVFQNSALISNLRAFDNVALPIRYHHPEIPENEVRQRVMQILESMMVDEYADLFPYAISMGAQRRVAIARALALEPRILLMDEPTAGLDAKNRRSLLALIENQRALRHASILIATHDLRIAQELNGQIVALHHGILSDPLFYEDFVQSPEDYIQDLIYEIATNTDFL